MYKKMYKKMFLRRPSALPPEVNFVAQLPFERAENTALMVFDEEMQQYWPRPKNAFFLISRLLQPPLKIFITATDGPERHADHFTTLLPSN